MHDLRYSLPVRRFHWLIFILVAAGLAMIYGHNWSPKGSGIRDAFKWAHIQFGITILLVMLPRVAARLRSTRPAIVPPLPSWQSTLAHLLQFVLYVLLFAVPLLGIANRLWSPSDWNFLGVALPHVPVTDKEFAKQIEEIHGTLGNVLMYLAGAHALIGLAHHFILHDSALRTMLPFWRQDEKGADTKGS
ncbi:MAG: cytochrome b [Burkholderiaceae bacterium]